MNTKANKPLVHLMDTTLRDGEQTPDVAFSGDEKLAIAQMLLGEVKVDRVEVCSALVSPGERESAERIANWARHAGRLAQVEVLGYADESKSVDWVRESGLSRMNLLVKGSERHCRLQLGLAPEEHVGRIASTLRAATARGVQISGAYLEDWSRGIVESPEYVGSMVTALGEAGVGRFYLADTLGVLSPEQVHRYVKRMVREFPHLQFEFHGHNDYGLATANCLAAVRAGASGVHTTVNGLGERAGNACLAQVAVALRDHAARLTAVDETRLPALSELVAAASGHRVSHNAPVVGEHAFTQTAGIHADGDAKAGLYCSGLDPERFGRSRNYALGKLSGRASLVHHLRELGVSVGPESCAELLRRVVAEGDGKRRVRPSDLQRWLAPPVLR